MKTLDDIIQDLKVSRRTIYRWIADPDSRFPKPEKIGKQLRWEDSQIDGFKNSVLRIEFDAETGQSITEAAGLSNQTVEDFLILAVKETIKRRTDLNPLYPVGWMEIEKKNPGMGLVGYLEFYNSYIEAIRNPENYLFDIRCDKKLLAKQEILGQAERERMSISQMQSFGYKVVGIKEK